MNPNGTLEAIDDSGESRCSQPAATCARPAQPELGMSLVEVLVAVMLMSLVAISILPLFARSTRQNSEGQNYTNLMNVARSTLEEYRGYDFNAPSLTIPVATNQLLLTQRFDVATRRWVTISSNDPSVQIGTMSAFPMPLFERRIVVEQFAAGDFLDNNILETPLSGLAKPQDVQLKRVRVTVVPLASSVLGHATPTIMEFIKTV